MGFIVPDVRHGKRRISAGVLPARPSRLEFRPTAGVNRIDGPPMLFPAGSQPQRWAIDAVLTAALGHRCCCSLRASDNGGPWMWL